MLQVVSKQSHLWTKFRFTFVTTKCLKMDAASMSIDIGGMRVKYRELHETFTEEDLVCREPIGQFKTWFEEACNTPGIMEANAMCLSTATKDGMPSARYVLLKGYGKDGFKFYTNYESRKGKELSENPRAALTFYWDLLKRSVRVEGTVQKLPSHECDDYFHSRPLDSRIGACTSHQSRVVTSREVLTERRQKLKEEYDGTDKILPRPSCWGGFLVTPESVEFWQGQSDRLHDRIRFRRKTVEDTPDDVDLHLGEDGWVFERLSP